MTTVFLVPRRKDNGHRDRVWDYCRARWEALFPAIPIYEGHHEDGPFNRSAAVNRAADNAGQWDLGIVIDSDVMLSRSQVQAAIDKSAETGRVTWAHRRWRGVTEDWTRRILDDQRDFGPEPSRDEVDLIVDRTNPLSWSCCFVIPRLVWDDMGGFDERFRGWGFEDMAFQSIVAGLYGHERIEGDVVHLWHPRSEERITPGQPRYTATPEYITNARLGRRYMVALRRDFAKHDRGDMPASEEERQRDIRNLKFDDAKFAGVVRRLGLPNWDDWWPRLEELRDGAKAARGKPTSPTVTVAVTSGGPADVWDARREYLAQSLASLTERVTGNIVQRIVFSDWPDAITRELSHVVEQYGFYVVGGGHHGYSEMRHRFFRYLNRKALGEYVFAAEDDFLYERDVDLAPMLDTLRDNPDLRQLALLRGPAFPREFEAGGVLPSLKTPIELVNHRAYPFIRHRDHFTCNPSLFRKSLTETAWPTVASSERAFGDRLLRDPQAAFAYWGQGEPWIKHLGEVRASPTGAY